MSDDVVEVLQRTFPKSVQPGLPKLKPPKPGWKSYRFGELLEQVQRRVHLQPDETYDLVTVKRSRGGIESRGRLRGSQISVTSQFRIVEGDFLISKRQIVHGACGVVSSEFDGAVVSNEYSVLRCKPNIDLAFLQYLSHSVYFQQTCFHSSIGVHIEKMIFKLDEWLKWPVNIPSLPEQQKIAAFLGAVDAKLSVLTAKQAALGRFKAGLMQKLFSQKLRFTRDDGKAFPEWQERRLGDFCDALSGFPVSGEDILEVGTATRLMRGANISEGAIRRSADLDRFFGGSVHGLDRFFLKVGDVVIGMDGSKVGKNVATIGPSDAGSFLIQRVTRLRNYGKNDLRFVYQHVTSPRFRQYVDVVNTSSGIPHISLKQIRDFEIPMPHPDEQKRIADALSTIDTKIQAVADQVTKLQTFKKGLLQQMFV